jgi:hypothetical protein
MSKINTSRRPVNDPADGAAAAYLTVADLGAYGLTRASVLGRCPGATEYRALDGQRCWRREDLAPLLARRGGAK